MECECFMVERSNWSLGTKSNYVVQKLFLGMTLMVSSSVGTRSFVPRVSNVFLSN